jgi:tetratricopeptide (TPR) repeat protein
MVAVAALATAMLAAETHADTPPAADHRTALSPRLAAMEGRKAQTLAGVQSLLQSVSLPTVLASGGTGWNLAQQYTALVRFGLWDELIAMRAPADPRAVGLRVGYLYGRGVALAARGRLDEARSTLAELRALDLTGAADHAFLRSVVSVAEPVVAARIAATERHDEEAVALLRQGVAAEDGLGYEGAADWFFPVRHLLGAQLLIDRQAPEAERVYREDLRRNPANGWALYGLAAALEAQGRKAEAAHARHEFEAAWQHADVRLTASAFWFAGPDTTSCECQREGLTRAATGW